MAEREDATIPILDEMLMNSLRDSLGGCLVLSATFRHFAQSLFHPTQSHLYPLRPEKLGDIARSLGIDTLLHSFLLHEAECNGT